MLLLSVRCSQLQSARLINSFDADVIVIGGGHAGCEGAAAAARCGARTILLTHNKSTIGEMSCNPSFGGIGKGHLIREIDALDGLCGRICDKSAITYQALNSGQGPAVLGLRAQIDRHLYKIHMQKEIFSTPNLEVFEGDMDGLKTEQNNGCLKVNGITLTNGSRLSAKSILITTGTFLGGEIFQGMEKWAAGRIGEKSAQQLSQSFKKHGFQLGRLRTGTPPRLLKNSIDFSMFEKVPPDVNPIPFSFMTKDVWLKPSDQLPTYLGYTNNRVRDLVEANLSENQHIVSETTGPRYCPSLEAKVIRFRELTHRMFLEHEGLDSPLIYPQGMSMTFKPEIQLQIMRSIKGMEKVEIAQYGYGVQYDFVNPKQLKPTLETKQVTGLFLAGQINGTTGYEEAAAQGVLAGVNAAARAYNEDGMVISRTQGYIGVLVDDLTSLGTNEPYRMFTSRAECRLHLRPDNADIRLTEIGRRWGVISDKRWLQYLSIKNNVDGAKDALKRIEMSLARWVRLLPQIETKSLFKVLSAYELLYRHNITIDQLATVFPERLSQYTNNLKLLERLRNEGSYELVHRRMQSKIEEIERESQTAIPEELDYSSMRGMSLECIEKLDRARPLNLAAASRIPGITPEAIIILLRYLKKPEFVSQNNVSVK